MKNEDSESVTSANSLPVDSHAESPKQETEYKRHSPAGHAESRIQTAIVRHEQTTDVTESRVSDVIVSSSAPSSTESETEQEDQTIQDRVSGLRSCNPTTYFFMMKFNKK